MILSVWVLINLPAGLIELWSRNKGAGGHPSKSIEESRRDGIFVEEVTDSLTFKGGIGGATVGEAWIEFDRDLEFVVSIIPFVYSHEIWHKKPNQELVVHDLSLKHFSAHAGATITLTQGDRALQLSGGAHDGNDSISTYKIPAPVSSELISIEFARPW